MPLTPNQVLWVLLWLLSIQVWASEYTNPIVPTENTNQVQEHEVEEKKISKDKKDDDWTLRENVEEDEENEAIKQNLEIKINMFDELQPETFISQEEEKNDEDGKISLKEFGSFKEKKEDQGQIFRKIDSPFQKLRWMQCLIVKNRLNYSDYIARIILDYLTFAPISTKLNKDCEVYDPTLTRDGHWLLCKNENINVLNLIDTGTGINVNQFFASKKIDVFAIADNHSFIVGGGETDVWIWETMSSHVVKVLTGHKAPINLCRIFRHDTRFVTMDEDNNLHVWSLTDNKPLFVLNSIYNCTVSADNINIVCLTDYGDILVWNSDMDDYLHQQCYNPHNDPPNFVAKLDDPQCVGLATENYIELWDIDTGLKNIIDISPHQFSIPPYVCYLSKDRLVWCNDEIHISCLQEYNTVDTTSRILDIGFDILSATVTEDNKYLVIVANDGITSGYIFTYDLNTAEPINIQPRK